MNEDHTYVPLRNSTPEQLANVVEAGTRPYPRTHGQSSPGACSRRSCTTMDSGNAVMGICGRIMGQLTTDTPYQQAQVAGKQIHDYMQDDTAAALGWKKGEGAWQADWIIHIYEDLVDWTVVGRGMLEHIYQQALGDAVARVPEDDE
ncbi:MAG: hypothetical protein JWL97_4406 [Gemmatimonadales bacterium]|nr:hypothetical protein [Gemmatimonadales bacterium]